MIHTVKYLNFNVFYVVLSCLYLCNLDAELWSFLVFLVQRELVDLCFTATGFSPEQS
jgi:hypothetical protein